MTKKALAASLFCAALLAAAQPALATPWHDFGPRAMAMGGAGVAVAQGPDAVFYNPAALMRLDNGSGFAVTVGGRGEFTGSVLQGANNINALNKACQNSEASCTNANITEALDQLGQPGNGAQVDAGAAVTFKFKRLAFFALNETYIGANPIVDRTLGVGVNQLTNNQSKLVLRGGMFTEFGVGYGHELWNSGVSVGGNLKGIVGKIGYNQITVASKDSGSGSFGDFKDTAKTSIQPGVDLGILWDVAKTYESAPWHPTLGMVGRNINCPKFSQPDIAKAAGEREKFSLNGQVRAGASLTPLNFWHLAADLDLAENTSYIDSYKSRYLSLGTELNVFNRSWINIPLRFGIQKNLSDTGSGLAWTGGVGFNLAHVMIDLGGQISAKRTTLQSEGKNERVPNNFAGAARFAILFGGSEKGPVLATEEVAPSTKPQ
ncbi:MAG: conjugal transfer protein TraF [Elusimicrobiota bacterium]|jgi:hypothetical protein